MYQMRGQKEPVLREANLFILPELTDLEGIIFELYSKHGGHIKYKLKKHLIHWFDPVTNKPNKAKYRATSIRDGIYFIDYLAEEQSVSIVLDLYNEVFTQVIGQLSLTPEQQGCSPLGVKTPPIDLSIVQGSLDKPYKENQFLHYPTDELIGSRYLFYCSNDKIYEHIYLNQKCYTWHCITGNKAGLADTTPCYYYKVANKLYLLVWKGKNSPYLGLMLIDMNFLRGDGKVCGYEATDVNKLFNLPISPYFTPINEPKRPINPSLRN